MVTLAMFLARERDAGYDSVVGVCNMWRLGVR
jgi:hypothetical protein